VLILGIGLLLVAAGAVLLLDLGGAARFVIRRLTSRSLGELAPGFAAGRGGFRVYAALLLFIGLATAGLAVSPALPLLGGIALALGGAGFLIASVVAIIGEGRVYRRLRGR